MKRIIFTLLISIVSLPAFSQSYTFGVLHGSLEFLTDTSHLHLNDSITIRYNILNAGTNTIPAGIKIFSSMKVKNRNGYQTYPVRYPEVLSHNTDSGQAYSGNITFTTWLYQSIVTTGENQVTLWPQQDTSITRDSFTFTLNLDSAVHNPLAIDPKTIVLSRDTTNILLNEPLKITYKITNHYYDTLKNITVFSRVRITNSSRDTLLSRTFGTKTVAAVKPGGLIEMAVSLNMTDSIFNKGENVVVIWPETDKTLPADTIALNLRLHYANSIPSLPDDASYVRFYPNPAISSIFIEHSPNSPSIKQIRILTTEGKEIAVPAVSDSIDVSFLRKGTYLLELQFSNGIKNAYKILKPE